MLNKKKDRYSIDELRELSNNSPPIQNISPVIPNDIHKIIDRLMDTTRNEKGESNLDMLTNIDNVTMSNMIIAEMMVTLQCFPADFNPSEKIKRMAPSVNGFRSRQIENMATGGMTAQENSQGFMRRLITPRSDK